MSPGITLSLHWYRGFGEDIQRDLFWWRYRLGFVTVALERQDTLRAYWKLWNAIDERIRRDAARIRCDQEGR